MINRILEKIIDIKSLDPVSFLGVADCNIKLIQSEIPINIIARDRKIKIIGNKNNVEQVNQIFKEMINTLNSRGNLEKIDVKNLININPVSVDSNATVNELLQMIKQCSFPILYLPVLKKDRKLAGIVNFVNLIKGEL